MPCASLGDYPRDSWLGDLGFLLDNGIKVSLVYGDLDFACPVSNISSSRDCLLLTVYQWNSGDAVAKAINWTGTSGYEAAQYAEIQTNDSYIGGLVRQHGNLSFIRTYQAGHEIPSYQPETAYKIFTRALFNYDIATGLESTAGTEEGQIYTSTGRPDPDVQLEPTGQELTYCYTYAPSGTCQPEQIEALQNGTAEICNWLVIDANSTQLFPDAIAECRARWSDEGRSNETGSAGNAEHSPALYTGSGSTLRWNWLFVAVSVVLLWVL